MGLTKISLACVELPGTASRGEVLSAIRRSTNAKCALPGSRGRERLVGVTSRQHNANLFGRSPQGLRKAGLWQALWECYARTGAPRSGPEAQ